MFTKDWEAAFQKVMETQDEEQRLVELEALIAEVESLFAARKN